MKRQLDEQVDKFSGALEPASLHNDLEQSALRGDASCAFKIISSIAYLSWRIKRTTHNRSAFISYAYLCFAKHGFLVDLEAYCNENRESSVNSLIVRELLEHNIQEHINRYFLLEAANTVNGMQKAFALWRDLKSKQYSLRAKNKEWIEGINLAAGMASARSDLKSLTILAPLINAKTRQGILKAAIETKTPDSIRKLLEIIPIPNSLPCKYELIKFAIYCNDIDVLEVVGSYEELKEFLAVCPVNGSNQIFQSHFTHEQAGLALNNVLKFGHSMMFAQLLRHINADDELYIQDSFAVTIKHGTLYHMLNMLKPTYLPIDAEEVAYNAYVQFETNLLQSKGFGSIVEILHAFDIRRRFAGVRKDWAVMFGSVEDKPPLPTELGVYILSLASSYDVKTILLASNIVNIKIPTKSDISKCCPQDFAYTNEWARISYKTKALVATVKGINAIQDYGLQGILME